MPNEADDIGEVTDSPNISALTGEFQLALTHLNVSVEANGANNVRLARWTGQSPDGKKHQKNMSSTETVFPFEGASDTRVLLCDQLISDVTDLCVTSFSRANLRCGATETNDLSNASVVETLLGWMRKRTAEQDLVEAELLSSHMLTYGFAVAQVAWEQGHSMKTQRLNVEEIAQAASQADGIVSQFPAMLQDPAQEDLCAELLLGQFSSLDKASAKATVKSLRETGAAEFLIQYVCKNQPVITALKPVEEICFPSDTIDLQSARVIFRRTWMTKEALRAKVLDDGWGQSFVDELCEKARGEVSGVSDAASLSTLTDSTSANLTENLYEVVWAYARQSNDDGVPAIYYTIFSPHSDGFAKHELLEYAHNEYPFVAFMQERLARRVTESRGVPHIVSTWQNEMKAQRDSIHDYASLSTLPPYQYLKRNGAPPALGAGVGVPVTKIGDIQFMAAPAAPTTAFNVIRAIEKQSNQYFGLPDLEIPPNATQMKAQRRMNGWLSSWNAVYRQVLALCIQYLPTEEVQRITGTQAVLDDNIDKYDLSLSFNVQELDSDLVQKRLQAIMQTVVPLDVSGRLDRSKLVEFLTMSIAPESASMLLVDQPTASQQLYNQVKTDMAQMLQGFEAQLVDASNDPSAPTKLQYAQQIAQGNPKLQQAVQSDEHIAKLYENYLKNLQMGVSQQQNKQIGRYGVNPNQQAQQ